MRQFIYKLDSHPSNNLDFENSIYPYKKYIDLRENGPLVRLKDGGWIALSYDMVETVFSDQRFGVTHPSDIAPRRILKDTNWFFKMVLTPIIKVIIKQHRQTQLTEDWLVFQDPPEHTRLRRLTQEAFTPKAINDMKPLIHNVTTKLLNKIEGKEKFDFVSEFAYPLPISLISEILGLSDENQDKFKKWSSAIINGFSVSASDTNKRKQARHAVDKAVDMFEEEIKRKKDEGNSDIISHFLNSEYKGEGMTEEEIISNSILLLIAGHETTVNLISNTLYALLDNPIQMDMLRSDLSLLDNTIEESLRYDPPVTITTRKAKERIIEQRYPIDKGEIIELSLYAANHDENQFENPHSFIITRENSKQHLSFGKGIHYCLGAPLARAEAKIAFTELINRFDEIKLAGTPQRAKSFGFSEFDNFPIIMK